MVRTPLVVIQGDITRLKVDAIVNAANEYLRGGGGVDGCIHRAAGPQLNAACAEIACQAKVRGELPCPPGCSRLTPAFQLPETKYIIHTVGPRSQNPDLLAKCYTSSLELLTSAEVRGRSIAFPCISTGAFGYPAREASQVAFNAVKEWLGEYEEQHGNALEKVIFCCHTDRDRLLYDKLLGHTAQAQIE